MVSEIVVDVKPKDISIAVMEDKSLVELQKEARCDTFAIGNIYLGKVRKIMPGLNSAFIDIGCRKDAFLHYQDLGSQFNTQQGYLKQIQKSNKKKISFSKIQFVKESEKEGSIGDLLTVGQDILVQIVKEPISTKGPRLTAEISMAGRFLVLMPFADKISISTKIKSNEERARLRQLIQSVKPKHFSVIVRTSAETKRVAELDSELRILVKHWEETLNKIIKVKAPTVIYEESARIEAILRDYFNETFENIHVNDKDVYNSILEYVSVIAPAKKDIVKLYDDELPIFDHFGITKQMKSLFARTVTLKGGAYMIIEHTEAMHVIDVNSGNRTKGSTEQETTALEVNSNAVNEIARQLRLRDMGGIIVIDFIDMHEASHRLALYEQMSNVMLNDRAKHNILPLSKFCLMQITRQRVRQILAIQTSEKCPTCLGTGKIQSSLLFTDNLERKIDSLANKHHIKKFSLHVHPFVASFLNKGIISLRLKWIMRFSLRLKVIPDQSLAFLEYKFFDPHRNEIEIPEEKE
ncbi:MAG: Rne/Rng family ribonuclease [Tannerella sp.]|nr:Rne/Rng family ribonuclease [Tannerella sp.]